MIIGTLTNSITTLVISLSITTLMILSLFVVGIVKSVVKLTIQFIKTIFDYIKNPIMLLLTVFFYGFLVGVWIPAAMSVFKRLFSKAFKFIVKNIIIAVCKLFNITFNGDKSIKGQVEKKVLDYLKKKYKKYEKNGFIKTLCDLIPENVKNNFKNYMKIIFENIVNFIRKIFSVPANMSIMEYFIFIIKNNLNIPNSYSIFDALEIIVDAGVDFIMNTFNSSNLFDAILSGDPSKIKYKENLNVFLNVFRQMKRISQLELFGKIVEYKDFANSKTAEQLEKIYDNGLEATYQVLGEYIMFSTVSGTYMDYQFSPGLMSRAIDIYCRDIYNRVNGESSPYITESHAQIFNTSRPIIRKFFYGEIFNEDFGSALKTAELINSQYNGNKNLAQNPIYHLDDSTGYNPLSTAYGNETVAEYVAQSYYKVMKHLSEIKGFSNLYNRLYEYQCKNPEKRVDLLAVNNDYMNWGERKRQEFAQLILGSILYVATTIGYNHNLGKTVYGVVTAEIPNGEQMRKADKLSQKTVDSSMPYSLLLPEIEKFKHLKHPIDTVKSIKSEIKKNANELKKIEEMWISLGSGSNEYQAQSGSVKNNEELSHDVFAGNITPNEFALERLQINRTSGIHWAGGRIIIGRLCPHKYNKLKENGKYEEITYYDPKIDTNINEANIPEIEIWILVPILETLNSEGQCGKILRLLLCTTNIAFNNRNVNAYIELHNKIIHFYQNRKILDKVVMQFNDPSNKQELENEDDAISSIIFDTVSVLMYIKTNFGFPDKQQKYNIKNSEYKGKPACVEAAIAVLFQFLQYLECRLYAKRALKKYQEIQNILNELTKALQEINDTKQLDEQQVKKIKRKYNINGSKYIY